jgi:hypothetical protein
MIPPDEHAEAIAAIAADADLDRAARIVTQGIVHDNQKSITEINRALAKFNEARASLRMALAAAVLVGCGLAVVWSLVLIVKWA